MTHCTLTRRQSRTNPITDLLRDRLAAQEAANDTRLIEAQDAARAPQTSGSVKTSPWPTVSEILRDFTFARYEFGTLYQSGHCIQAAMTVTNPSDPADRYLVQLNTQTGEWSCYCPAGKKDGRGVVFIDAVQRKVEQNRAERQGKAVN